MFVIYSLKTWQKLYSMLDGNMFLTNLFVYHIYIPLTSVHVGKDYNYTALTILFPRGLFQEVQNTLEYCFISCDTLPINHFALAAIIFIDDCVIQISSII